MLVAALEIARNSIDHDAPDFWGREAITRTVPLPMTDAGCPREFQAPVSIEAVSDVPAADDKQRRMG